MTEHIEEIATPGLERGLFRVLRRTKLSDAITEEINRRGYEAT